MLVAPRLSNRSREHIRTFHAHACCASAHEGALVLACNWEPPKSHFLERALVAWPCPWCAGVPRLHADPHCQPIHVRLLRGRHVVAVRRELCTRCSREGGGVCIAVEFIMHAHPFAHALCLSSSGGHSLSTSGSVQCASSGPAFVTVPSSPSFTVCSSQRSSV
jgi:hypothetical protein